MWSEDVEQDRLKATSRWHPSWKDALPLLKSTWAAHASFDVAFRTTQVWKGHQLYKETNPQIVNGTFKDTREQVLRATLKHSQALPSVQQLG